MHARDTTEPSPFAHELLNGKPYTYLDDAPLEERRTRAVSLRRSLPEHQRDLGVLDLAAIERVRDDAVPEARDADELHDLLLQLMVVPAAAEWARQAAPLPDARRCGRAARVATDAGELGSRRRICGRSRCCIRARCFAAVTLPAHLDAAPPERKSRCSRRCAGTWSTWGRRPLRRWPRCSRCARAK